MLGTQLPALVESVRLKLVSDLQERRLRDGVILGPHVDRVAALVAEGLRQADGRAEEVDGLGACEHGDLC